MKKNKKSMVLFERSLKRVAITGIVMAILLVLCGCSGNKSNVDGTIWETGSDCKEFSNAKTGDFFIDTDDYILYQKSSDGWDVIMTDFGKPGTDAAENDVEFRIEDGYIQCGNITESGTEWENLIALADLSGENGYTPYIKDGYWFIHGVNQNIPATGASGNSGKSIEIQKSTTAIQWRYAGDTDWKDLVELSVLKGQDGENGKSVKIAINAGNIQWRYDDDSNEWQTIIATDTLKGADGTTPHIDTATGNWFIGETDTGYKAAGVNGKEIVLQTTEDYIQWKYTGDEQWNDLIALSSLKGATGSIGTAGLDGEDGTIWESGLNYSEFSDAKTGDFFVDTDDCILYKKSEDGWDIIMTDFGKSSQEQSCTYMHLSLDDVEISLGHLTQSSSYTSVWDEPLLAFLKELHDTYGAKFSLYTYNSTLANVSSKYADELNAAHNWLKFGLHATNSSSTFGSSSYSDGKNAWNTFVDNITRIAGSYLSVDRMPRLHYFAGSEDALKGMRDANYGALGFLSADDSRVSYYFTSEQATYLYDHDHLSDNRNGLVFLSTDMRGDWFKSGFTSSNTYRTPTKSTVYEELEYRFSQSSFANSASSYIFFAHEWQFYNGSTLTSEGKQWFIDACRFASENHIDFDFSENRNMSRTPYDIYASGSSQSQDDPASPDDPSSPETTTVEYWVSGTKVRDMTVVDSISEMTFVKGRTICGTIDDDFLTTTGRAASIDYVLSVQGGETLSVVANLNEAFDSANLYYGIVEIASAPLQTSTLVNESDLRSSGREWVSITESTTLNQNTRYLILAFKNGDGSTDFTDEQVALLNSCMQISE